MQTVDGRNVRGPSRRQHSDEEEYRHRQRPHGEGEFAWQRRTPIDVENMARDAFGRIDDIHEDVVSDDGQPHIPQVGAEGDAECDEQKLEYLVGESTQQVFEGSTQNRLQCAIVLFSLCSLYSVPNTFTDALLTWIAGDLLPTSNCFPRTSYEIKTMLMKLGLQHKQVHCCTNGHVLYEGDKEDLHECPTCGEPRFIQGSTAVPRRVVRYFDFVKHFLRMFKCPEVAKYMTWYDSHKCGGHKMRSAADGLQWKTIDQLYPDFAAVKTNLRLGLIADGIIPFKNSTIKHSTWVLMFTIYNLPPWLLTKKIFISLAVLIPGPKATTSENIDVFLGPVVRDFLKLWRGVPAVNMSQPEGQRAFTLRALLMWTVNDFPAYGLLSGQQVHGYKGCPICGPETCSEYARLLHKMIYMGSRRHLAPDHPFRRARTAFNNHQEWEIAPERPTGEEVCRWGTERDEFLRQGGTDSADNDPVRVHGVKQKSIFFMLPYWKVFSLWFFLCCIWYL